MRYSIEAQELTDIADAIRRKCGETRIEKIIVDEIVPDVVVNKTPNATGFGKFDDTTFTTIKQCFPTRIDGAKSIKVRFTYQTSTVANYGINIISGYHETISTLPSNAKLYQGTSSKIEELVFENTNCVTIYAFLPNSATGNKGYYAEISGLDADGNSMGGTTVQVEKEIEVKNTFTSAEMAQAIDDMPKPLPKEAFILTGDCGYKFSYNGWNWFIDAYKDNITTKDITAGNAMFYVSSGLKEIPFVLNFTPMEGINLNAMFQGCSSLTTVPRLYVPNGRKVDMASVASGCSKIRDGNGLFVNEDEFCEAWSSYINKGTFDKHYCSNAFYNWQSLRQVPTWFFKLRLNPESTSYPYQTNALYASTFYCCFSLDEVVNVPVWKCKGAMTSNMFGNFITSTYRLKALTFEKNEDGSPVVTEWKAQTIDCSNYAGWTANVHTLVTSNGGITIDKEVKDDTTYQALKDDPAWFSAKSDYSRYNHDSAVDTINSLPDTSAYLATAGGTNTIKFKGVAGALTDGGAINTLTAEEIAVATAKGWTVTFA